MKIKKCCIALKGVFLLGSGGGLKTVVSIVTIQVNTKAAMWARLNGCGDLTFSLHCSFEPKEHINFLEEIHQASKVNIYYYSLKIFPQFWLAKSTRLIHHNQLLLTKFARILCLTRKWRKKMQPSTGYWTINREDLGTRLSCFGWENKMANTSLVLR